MPARQPIDLVKAKGRTHLTSAQYEKRKAEEIKVPFTDIEPPDYLTGKKQIKKFMHYAGMLRRISPDFFTELDVDCLARYVLAEQLYLVHTSTLLKLAKECDIEGMRAVQSLQDKAFKQCHQCASALGMTISSRCKLIIPQVDDDEDLEL